jgi:DnaJ-class molecular chaperone
MDKESDTWSHERKEFDTWSHERVHEPTRKSIMFKSYLFSMLAIIVALFLYFWNSFFSTANFALSGSHPPLLSRDGSYHYAVLSIEKRASLTEIQKAFRTKALIYHPDKPCGNENEFTRLASAREVLSNPSKRRNYDLTENSYVVSFELMLAPECTISLFSAQSSHRGSPNCELSDHWRCQQHGGGGSKYFERSPASKVKANALASEKRRSKRASMSPTLKVTATAQASEKRKSKRASMSQNFEGYGHC